MKLNTPLPQPLPKECAKASKIFKSFVDSGNNGLDGVIPRHVLVEARGFAIFTIVKAGFLFSARAGSGVVIARLDDGTWSAPSAIGTAGLGVGGQVGAEVTDFLIVLNSRSAVRSFMSAGSLTLGGNMSIAIGPLGRNGEASGALNTNGKIAAMYSYSKTRGLFGGVSVEGSVIVERQDANAIAYNSDVSARMLLSGSVDAPEWASVLINTIESCTGMPGGRKWVNDTHSQPQYAFGEGIGSLGSTDKKKNRLSTHLPSFSRSKSYASNASSDMDDLRSSYKSGAVNFDTEFKSDFDELGSLDNFRSRPPVTLPSTRNSTNRNSTYQPNSPFNDLPPFPSETYQKRQSRSLSISKPAFDDPFDQSVDGISDSLSKTNRYRSSSVDIKPRLTPKAGLDAPLRPHEGVARAIALYDFRAVEAGDLSFKKGQVITVIKKSDKVDDWWTGKVDGKEGIFPANFVEVV